MINEYENPGFLKLYRRFFSHFLWEEKRIFSKAEAWIDLLSSARYSEGTAKKMIDGKLVTWDRGQLIASIRFLQRRWKWNSTSKVERFLKMLIKEEMITIDKEQGTGRITICNYESYNPLEDSDETTHKKKDVLTFNDTSIEIILSKQLYDKIKTRNPQHKEPNLQSWAKHIDLMIRIEKRSIADIQRIIDWCQQDSFWQNNILSTSKLREKFDQLKLKMENPNANYRVSSFKKSKGTITSDEYRRQLEQIYQKDGDDSLIY